MSVHNYNHADDEAAAMMDQAAHQRVGELQREITALRSKNSKLHRRCQQAEAAIKDAHECIQTLSNGKPWCSGSLGRALLACEYRRLSDELTALRAENAAMREALEDIAKQKTVSEFEKLAEAEGLDPDDADYTEAYDSIVRTARSVLTTPPAAEEKK